MKEKTNYPTDAVVPKQVLIPFILITSLFALWGFANDITNPMVSAFKKVLELNNAQASWVQMAFYGGYFTMALPAAIFVKKFSYKSGIMVGLALYATGALLFFPAASYEMYGFFLAALYILTFGLAFLETTANPYILSMGSPETATRRLNLAQAFNPIGSLMGMFIAQRFILQMLQSDDVDYAALDEATQATIRAADLMVIRNPYVILGLVVIGFLVLIGVSKMPKNQATGGELQLGDSIAKVLKDKKYVFGVIAQAFYVGAQIMCWTYIFQYAESLGIDNATAVYYNVAAMVLFLGGRWVATALMKFVNTGMLLAVFAVGAFVTTLGAMFLVGYVGLYALVAVSFFMSLMFPTIYGIALRGMGEEAKFGAAGLVMAIVGGALLPFFQGLILDIGGKGLADTRIMGVPEINFSFVLPLLCFVVVAAFGYKSGKVYLK